MQTDVTRAIQRECCGRVSPQVRKRSEKLYVDPEEGAEKWSVRMKTIARLGREMSSNWVGRRWQNNERKYCLGTKT